MLLLLCNFVGVTDSKIYKEKLDLICMSKETLSAIDRIMGNVRTHPEYSDCVSRNFANYLVQESHKHSFELEKSPGDDVKTFIKNLGDARELLRTEGISKYSLPKLGHIIQPISEEKPTPSGFRTTEINFQYAPASEKIHQEMDNFEYFLNNSAIHPVKRAAEAHLELVRIHPYIDGNGRAARLLQNFCLEQRGYPQAIIKEEEKEFYIALIGNALNDRVQGKGSLESLSQSEELFHNFIESKILSSAKSLEGEMRKNRIYQVDLSRLKDMKIGYHVTNALRNKGKKESIGGIKISSGKGNRKTQSLKVQGNIGLQDVDTYLEKLAKKYKFKYKIKSLTDC